MAQYGLDFSPVLNVLGRLQQDRQFQQSQAENQRQFNAQNMLAQGRFNRENEELARAEAQRGQIRNLLAGGQGFDGVPKPLLNIGGVTGDPEKIQDYLIAEAKRKAGLSGPEGYGKTGAVFQDPKTGEFKAVQFGERGTLKMHPLPGMEPARGITIVGDEAMSSSTARPVRNVGPQIANKEVAEGEGKNVAKVRADLAENKARLNLALGGLSRLKQSVQSLQTQPGLDRVVGGLYQAMAPNVSTGALNAATELENVKVKVSGAVLQAMRDASKTGGAVGQVTEREWPRLENMIANLDPRQGKEQFGKNLAEIVKYADQVSRTLTEAYEADVAVAQRGVTTGQPSGGAAAQAPRRLRFNPQTGGLE